MRRWFLSKSLYGVSCLLGIMITGLLLKLSWDELINGQRDLFNAEHVAIVQTLKDRIKGVDETAYAMQALFDASTEIEPDEFRIVSEGILKRNTYISAVIYAPRVAERRRQEFIEEQRELGYVSFDIHPLPGEQAAPAAQTNYFPIVYIEPFQPETARLLGVDMRSITRYQAEIKEAIRSGRNIAGRPDVLDIYPLGLSYLKAVYAGKAAAVSATEREQMVNGLLVLRIDLAGLFSELADGANTDVSLALVGANHVSEVVYSKRGASVKPGADIAQLARDIPITIGGREFVFTINKHVSSADIDQGKPILAVVIGLVIMGLLLLLARFVYAQQAYLRQRNKEINAVVELRTKELAFEKDRAHTMLQSIGDGVITTNAKGHIESMNLVAEKMTGWFEADAHGRLITAIFNVIEEQTQQAIDDSVLRCLADGVTIKLWQNPLLVSRSGKRIAIDATAAPVFDREGALTGAVLVFRDVSKERELAQQMMYQATHDALTDLPNRALLMDRIKQALARSHNQHSMTAILFLDLDRFKTVNDTLGHDVGDYLLMQVAHRLKNRLHADDTISRLGGDEFVIVLQDLRAKEHIAQVAQRIVAQFKAPFLINDVEFYTSFSIGISVYPENGQDEFTLMKNADAAMYQAKAAGKNNYKFYSAEMNEISALKLSLEADLRKAIERRELCLHYQPQVETDTGRIIGAEALVRWQHPTRGLVPPLNFIPLAEETGLILPIGQWVLEEACQQNKAWQDAGYPPVQMAVNIADAQFQKPDLIHDVKKVLEDTGLLPQYLEMELTEGVLAHNSDASIATLQELRAMGVSLSIDDFGTGYSSLSYLKRFPLNTLKVDRAFVRDITVDHDDAAICSTIIAMAHNLNLSVVAEGVEDKHQLEFLSQRGCHYIQGYYFSPPLAADKFAELLVASNGYIRKASNA